MSLGAYVGWRLVQSAVLVLVVVSICFAIIQNEDLLEAPPPGICLVPVTEDPPALWDAWVGMGARASC